MIHLQQLTLYNYSLINTNTTVHELGSICLMCGKMTQSIFRATWSVLQRGLFPLAVPPSLRPSIILIQTHPLVGCLISSKFIIKDYYLLIFYIITFKPHTSSEMDNTEKRLSPEAFVGVQVKLKTSLGEEFEGTIFSYDNATNCVVLIHILNYYDF